jgi:hypothetical protein
MDLPEETIGKGEAAAQPLDAMIQRGHMIRYLDHIVQGNSWNFLQLEEEKVGERGLGSLDLRGEDRLLTDVHVEKEVCVGKKRGYAVQPPQ